MSAYDPNNIFAKILRGEAPCVSVCEDADALAFMDVMPRADGHTLVIPKVAARNLLDMPEDALARLMPAVKRVAGAVKQAMAAEGIALRQSNEPAGGQDVFHLHFHILPRWEGVALRPPGGPVVPAAQLEPHAAKIREALKVCSTRTRRTHPRWADDGFEKCGSLDRIFAELRSPEGSHYMPIRAAQRHEGRRPAASSSLGL
jgi:histidine triad (HIT) family protein